MNIFAIPVVAAAAASKETVFKPVVMATLSTRT